MVDLKKGKSLGNLQMSSKLLGSEIKIESRKGAHIHVVYFQWSLDIILSFEI